MSSITRALAPRSSRALEAKRRVSSRDKGREREGRGVLLARVAKFNVLSNVVGGDREDERVLGGHEEVHEDPANERVR
jgi:hypothetical protein